jgi:hypothetical protein
MFSVTTSSRLDGDVGSWHDTPAIGPQETLKVFLRLVPDRMCSPDINAGLRQTERIVAAGHDRGDPRRTVVQGDDSQYPAWD